MQLLDIVTKGSTDRSVTIRIIDSTDGTPENAVEHNTSGIDLWYRREGAAKSSITEAALAALTDAHADGGIELIGDGYYRLDLPDAAFATGANHVDVGGTVTGMIVIGGRVRLVDYSLEDSVRMGLTALPIAAAGAAGGLPTDSAGKTAFNDPTAAAIRTEIDSNSTQLAAILEDTGTTLVGQISALNNLDAGAVSTAVWNAATATYGSAGSYGLLIETNLDAAVSTASAPTAAAVADAVWDELQSGHVGAGTFGEIATEIASVLADTGELQTDWTNGGRLDLIVDAILNDTDLIDDATSGLAKIATDVAAVLADTAVIGAAGAGLTAVPWNAAWDAEVQSEVADGLTAFWTSPATLVDLVWDEATSGHSTAGTTGKALTDAGSAGDPWSTSLPGSYTGTQAGKVLADVLVDTAAMPTAASISDAVWTEAIGDHSAVSGSTAEALAAAGGSGDPWVTTLPGSYTGSQAGKILADILTDTGTTLDGKLNTIDGIVDDILVDTAAIPAFPTNFADLAITATTGRVTVGTNADKTGYSISGTITTLDALDTAQDNQHAVTQGAISTNQATLLGLFPTNFTDLAITATTGLVSVGTNNDKTGYSISGTVTTLDPIAAYIDTEVAAIKGVTDKLDTALEADGASGYQYTTLALENGPAGGGGGGDATAASQTTIITHLTDIKGAGWSSTTDTLEKIRDAITGVGGAVGPGAIEWPVTVLVSAVPVEGAAVWITTDEAGTNTIAGVLYTNASGIATFMLDAGTYYAWAQRSGVNITNPTEITVA